MIAKRMTELQTPVVNESSKPSPYTKPKQGLGKEANAPGTGTKANRRAVLDNPANPDQAYRVLGLDRSVGARSLAGDYADSGDWGTDLDDRAPLTLSGIGSGRVTGTRREVMGDYLTRGVENLSAAQSENTIRVAREGKADFADGTGPAHGAVRESGHVKAAITYARPAGHDPIEGPASHNPLDKYVGARSLLPPGETTSFPKTGSEVADMGVTVREPDSSGGARRVVR